jgi:hypothetical protein
MKSVRDMTDVELENHLDALFNSICADFGNVVLDQQLQHALDETEKREKNPAISTR